MPARTASRGVPEDLGIHMRVPIDETRRHDVTFGVDLGATTFGDPPDGGDPIPHHADIGAVGPKSGAIDDGPASDHDVIGHLTPLTSRE